LRIDNQYTTFSPGGKVGTIEFYSNDTSTNGVGVAGAISVEAENAGSLYGMTFSTKEDATETERMRVTSAGNVGIGTGVNGGVKMSHLAGQKRTTLLLYSRDRPGCQY